MKTLSASSIPEGTESDMNTEKVTRVEVIDENGRSYVNWNDENKVELSLQDDGKTLKVFISQSGEKV